MKGITILGAVLFLAVSFSIDSNAESYNDLNYSEENTEEIAPGSEVKVDENVIARLALDVAHSMQDKDLAVSDIIPIYDVNGQIASYDVSYSYNGLPHGYVDLDLRLEDYVSKCNFNEGAKSVYFSLLNQNGTTESEIESGNMSIQETLPTEYNIQVDNEVINDFEENYSVDEFEEIVEETAEEANKIVEASEGFETLSSKYNGCGAFFITYPVNYTIKSMNYLSFFNTISESHIKNITKKYACSVSTMATITSSYGLFNAAKDSELKSVYNQLWTLSSTKTESVENGFTYGSTHINNIGPALKTFAQTKNVNFSYSRYSKPSWTTISGAIKSKKPIALNVFYNRKTGGQSAHTIFVQGTSGSKTHNFIVMFDGWNEGAAYMNYSTIPSTLVDYNCTIFSKAI